MNNESIEKISDLINSSDIRSQKLGIVLAKKESISTHDIIMMILNQKQGWVIDLFWRYHPTISHDYLFINNKKSGFETKVVTIIKMQKSFLSIDLFFEYVIRHRKHKIRDKWKFDYCMNFKPLFTSKESLFYNWVLTNDELKESGMYKLLVDKIKENEIQ